MRVSVLGGVGARPTAQAGCSGYLVEQDAFRLLVDPGYATVQRLLSTIDAPDVSAVYVTHGHPDHCIDLSALLRARIFRSERAAPLPVYAPAGALDAVLRLDEPDTLTGAFEQRVVEDGETFEVGPFTASAFLLPHWLPNLALRLKGPDGTLAYTGDTGPSPKLLGLARDADLLIAEASYAEEVPATARQFLSTAVDAAGLASDAKVGHLILTHVMPFVDEEHAQRSARARFSGGIDLAKPGRTFDVGSSRD